MAVALVKRSPMAARVLLGVSVVADMEVRDGKVPVSQGKMLQASSPPEEGLSFPSVASQSGHAHQQR